jgi:hypothetical protein
MGSTPATVGAMYGAATLSPLGGGSTGGVGQNPAGASGGAIQLVAGTSITIESGGVVAATGGGGGPSGTSMANAVQTGSGGGSGGAILIESLSVTLTGTIAANGGGGGGNSAGNVYGQDGQNGSTAAMGSGTGSGLGGSGAAAATVAGTAGANGNNLDIPPGGGGGGAGWIRINSMTAPSLSGATLSPSNGSSCVSTGTVAP